MLVWMLAGKVVGAGGAGVASAEAQAAPAMKTDVKRILNVRRVDFIFGSSKINTVQCCMEVVCSLTFIHISKDSHGNHVSYMASVALRIRVRPFLREESSPSHREAKSSIYSVILVNIANRLCNVSLCKDCCSVD